MIGYFIKFILNLVMLTCCVAEPVAKVQPKSRVLNA